MSQWLSSDVKEQPKVREALSDLADKIREYEDAAKPTACREMGGGFWSPELTLFRPGRKLFTIVSVGCGIGGVIFSRFMPNFEASTWAALALTVTIPVFVLGISLVTLARSLSESGRFAVEYLNDSCRMPWFCCLTLVAVLCGVVGRLSTLEWFPNFVSVGLSTASVGAAIVCLGMLAFVIRETIRCSVPSESVGVILRYAARKLTWGYFKEKHVTVFQKQRKDYLEKWCAGKAIHPPSQHCVPYIHSGHADNSVEIELDEGISGQNVYKDYDLKGLERLNKYLRKNNAELYLSSPFFESERKMLGILSCANVKQNEQLRSEVRKRGGKTIKWRKHKFSEEYAEFWESHLSALETALGVAIKNGEPDQVRRYLDVALKPLSALRALTGYKIIADVGSSGYWREYEFIRFYLKALRKILEMSESDHVFDLAREVRRSIWEETKNILRDMDYRTMELFTWLVQQIYTLIQDKEEGKKLQEMRGQFGGFYEFADGWLEDSESKNAEDMNKMRLVLHEGLTKWLLVAIKKKDEELIEQLCGVGRKIVFGGEEIKFDNREVVAQHFVLAGYLINLVKQKEIDAAAIEKLFYKPHLHELKFDFDELVKFYLDNSPPLETLRSYTREFFSATKETKNLLTGNSSSSGYGMTGVQEMSLTFIFMAAHALARIHPLPNPVVNMSGKIMDRDVEIIKEVFKIPLLNHGLAQLEKWIKTCEELNETEEAKEIAEAELAPAKVKEWETKFWESYSRAVPVLSMCLKNGNYEIDDNIKNEQHYHLSKIAVIDWRIPISGASGDDYGLSIGHKMEKNLLDAIIEHSNEESEAKNSMAEAIGEAVKWLEREGCSNDKGIILVTGKRLPEIEMHGDKDFREEVKSMGFNGFYRGFPISWLREGDEDEGEKNGAKEKKPQSQMVVAVDFRGWIGLRVRKEVVTDQRFGELKIRTWKPEEIQQAIEAGKLEAKDVDKAKGNCPVDVTFFWESVQDKLPRIRSIKF